jgi:L,D-peptidoglycan transpeptidase YkuD (ErfK/YbiS/YcfS/YnhG family)
MSVGRILSSIAASLAVGACAVVAIGMSRAPSLAQSDSGRSVPPPTRTARPAYIAPTTPTSMVVTSSAAASTSPIARAITPAGSAAASAKSSAPRVAIQPRPAARTTSAAAAKPKPVVRPAIEPTRATSTARGQSLPLPNGTGSATRVITVVAHSHSSTTATLQAWTKASGGGWKKYGSAVPAHVGSDGIGSASEYRSATPAGSFTLTQAFGHNGDPGTSLPYRHTTSADWWISQAGRLYNTHQVCSSGCSFDRGSNTPNEHLYYETPYYNYAVVIDYNTRNAPGGVKAGKGSAFFLHVTDGRATAGCVAISQTKLISIMRWLTPSTHPRVLIGVT